MTFRRVTRHELVGAGLAPPGVNCMYDRAAARKTLKRTRFLSLRTGVGFGQRPGAPGSLLEPRSFTSRKASGGSPASRALLDPFERETERALPSLGSFRRARDAPRQSQRTETATG